VHEFGCLKVCAHLRHLEMSNTSLDSGGLETIVKGREQVGKKEGEESDRLDEDVFFFLTFPSTSPPILLSSLPVLTRIEVAHTDVGDRGAIALATWYM